jgi:hypothetical protein
MDAHSRGVKKRLNDLWHVAVSHGERVIAYFDYAEVGVNGVFGI